jgi:hypothetical protein
LGAPSFSVDDQQLTANEVNSYVIISAGEPVTYTWTWLDRLGRAGLAARPAADQSTILVSYVGQIIAQVCRALILRAAKGASSQCRETAWKRDRSLEPVS